MFSGHVGTVAIRSEGFANTPVPYTRALMSGDETGWESVAVFLIKFHQTPTKSKLD